MARVLIVGAGAAGLMAAGAAVRQGHQVTVLEHTEKPGQKILVTGKGRCNVTNDCDVREFLNYVRHNPRFLYSALYAFSPASAMELFESLGVPLKTERGRRVFPQSLGSGQYVYTLPRTSLAALRLDPCSPEENKAVTLTMSDITLNAADTLPAVWQYFVPTWYQAFCLVLYPALAAAAVSMVGAVVTERKRK